MTVDGYRTWARMLSKACGPMFCLAVVLSITSINGALGQPGATAHATPEKKSLTKPPVPQGSGASSGNQSRAGMDCREVNGTGVSQESSAYPGTSKLLVTLADGVSWQPRNGRIRFTIRTTDNTVPAKALSGIETAVCFGWPVAMHTSPDTADTAQYFAAPYLRTVDRTDNSITYETGLPDGLWSPAGKVKAPSLLDVLWYDVRDSWNGKPTHVYDGLGLVPLVHMRVVARSGTAVDDDPNLLDTVLSVGVPFRIMAVLLALASLAILWALLMLWVSKRQIRGGPVLSIIANSAGYASLTQFQILLWTVVIAAGLTYVMALTGALIDVPLQELALLGIAGFSALSAGIATNKDKPKAGDAALPAQAAPVMRAHPIPEPPPPSPAVVPVRKPQWGDLVIWDGTGDVDVTRLQMLVFTVLAAGFVVIKICDENMIPTIPDGIILLMGLANGVYVGGRFINTKSAD